MKSDRSQATNFTASRPKAALAKFRAGFTLLELLTSMAILALMVSMLFSAFDHASRSWTQAENRVETFTQARAILDLMSREVSRAIATSNITFNGTANSVYFIAPLEPVSDWQCDLCEIGYVFNNTTPNKATLTRRVITPTPANVAGLIWNFYLNPSGWWSSASFANTVVADVGLLKVNFQYLDPATGIFSPTYQSQGHLDKVPLGILISMDLVDSKTAGRLPALPAQWVAITNSTVRSFSTLVYLPNVR